MSLDIKVIDWRKTEKIVGQITNVSFYNKLKILTYCLGLAPKILNLIKLELFIPQMLQIFNCNVNYIVY